MECIRIIQIGDVHYPEKFNKSLVDLKDGGLSDDFVNDISPNAFDKVSRELIRELESGSISAVLFSGDLTSFGDIKGYEACVNYFMDMFESMLKGKNPFDIHVVPGNHDVDRSLAGSSDKYDKFTSFVDVWKKRGSDLLSPKNVRRTVINNNNSKIQLLSLNTCVGCGEVRYFPDKVKEKIQELLSKINIKGREDFEIFGEKLDTPAASQSHIGDIETYIKDNAKDNIASIVIGHHGLLPQPVIRTEIYTEMINGGHIRFLLNSLEYPVIYCHGHIHDDPVEMITQPIYEKSNLITISAPEYCEGFNIIELYFSGKNIPIGCVIKPQRMKNFGGVRPEMPIRIRLQKNKNIADYCHNKVSDIYKLIPASEIFFRDFINNSSVRALMLSKEDLSSILLELEWIGVIEIDNRQREHSSWIIKRVGL